MKVTVRSEDINISMPVPIAMADMAVRAVPDHVFEKVMKKVGVTCDVNICREALSLLLKECKDILRENRGLEIIHVEDSDGTYVSIVL